jgi:hypothetical protein
VRAFVYSEAAARSCRAVAVGEWPGAAPGGAAAGGGTRRWGRGSQVGPLHQVAPENKPMKDASYKWYPTYLHRYVGTY